MTRVTPGFPLQKALHEDFELTLKYRLGWITLCCDSCEEREPQGLYLPATTSPDIAEKGAVNYFAPKPRWYQSPEKGLILPPVS